jgi:hypothetical protein
MPSSTRYFKKQTVDYIKKHYNQDSKILDIGPGIGTYYEILASEGYKNIDCVEAFGKYVDDYKLIEKYNNVFIGPIQHQNINFNEYDLIIMGDVLEHMSYGDAKNVLQKMLSTDVIIAIPFLAEQGIHFDNEYEIHIQSDLDIPTFFTRYPEFKPLCIRYDYGVFVKRESLDIFFEEDSNSITEEYKEFLNKRFPLSKIKIVGADNTFIKKDSTNIAKQLVQGKTTVVTGLWNIKRDGLSEGWSRPFQHYLDKFEELLKVPHNLIVYGEQELEQFVWKHRRIENTQFIIREQGWFKNEIYDKIQKIRTDPNWYNQTGWLPESTQAKLDMYNPIVMSKMFLLNDARILDKFNSDNLYWIDAGITNTVHSGYFTHDKVLDKLTKYVDKFSFICFPYNASNEIHGFSYPKINEYAADDVRLVARGGVFGGPKNTISDINGIYYQLLTDTLRDGYMGTEESIFSIMLYSHSDKIDYFEIEENGLLNKFFEDLKNDTLEKKSKRKTTNISTGEIGLYIITYNSPNQVQTLINSMLEYDVNFINKPKKFLLDNSTNIETQPAYKDLCEKYNFTHIKKDNIGICGGRQFIAEHAAEQQLGAYFFFEDDMFFYPKQGEVCRNGFNRKVDNLYNTLIDIINKENFDFLKLSFSEFFGDNGKQWAWYNVPQHVRTMYWPECSTLPDVGVAENSPRTNFKYINTLNSIPYISGEIYYSNWPQLVSREGNKKMFLDTKWAHPFEQTWMSHIFQETKNNNIHPGLLLISPTEHNRFDFYPAHERREN